MRFYEINSVEEFDHFKTTMPALLIYFSNEGCNVCKTLKPKVEFLVGQEFPKMSMVYVKTDVLSETAGQNRVFTIPTILIFFYGKETIRRIRNFSIEELIREIKRPYSLIFPE